jgi:hypothetical protein
MMKIKQLSVFLENKSGRLAKMTRALGDAQINILAMSLADTTEFGILRLIVNDVAKAADILKEHAFVCMVNEVTAVEVGDQPGSLANILEILAAAGINVEYSYAFSELQTGKASLIFRFDDAEKAVVALMGAGVNVLARDDLGVLKQ